jgi:hypothetical protein
MLALALGTGLGSVLLAGDTAKLPFDTYSGYFVSNKFEPDAATPFVVINDQTRFDLVSAAASTVKAHAHADM